MCPIMGIGGVLVATHHIYIAHSIETVFLLKTWNLKSPTAWLPHAGYCDIFGSKHDIHVIWSFNHAKQVTTTTNHTITTMKALSPAQCNHILSLLDSGHSGHEISTQTRVSNATMSRLHSRYHSLPKKPSGGCHPELSGQDMHNALQLIGTGGAENAVQMAKTLQNVSSQSLSAHTVWNRMK